MKKTYRKFKQPIALLLVFMMLVAQNSTLILGFGLLSTKQNIEVVNAVYASQEIDLANSDFESPTSINYPLTPNSFTAEGVDAGITAGIINVTEDVYDEKAEEDYKLDFNPETSASTQANENQVLMINAESTELRYGYKSTSFSLAEDGYYTVSVWVFTQNFGGIISTASLYLTGDTQVEDSSNSKLLAISTSGAWQEYKFFVQTDKLSSKTIQLELYLGSKTAVTSAGAVFFDDIKIESHSNDYYNKAIDDIPLIQTNYRVLNLRAPIIEDAVVNDDFEQTIVDPETNNIGWEVITENGTVESENTISGVVYVDENFDSVSTGIDTSPTNANIYENTRALLINNLTPQSLGYKSSDILVESQKLYKLSVMVKTSDLTHGAVVRLVQTNVDDEEDFSPITKNIGNINTTNQNNAKYEGWIEYSFYIKGGVYEDDFVNLELWLGSAATSEAGYVFFDQVTLEQLPSLEFNDMPDVNTANFSFSNPTGTLEINNSNFNSVVFETVEDHYPYVPKDWTLSSDDGNSSSADVKNGIINTNTDHFNDIKDNEDHYDGFANPGNINNVVNDLVHNNVLVIGNNTATTQTYSSSNKTLSPNLYYKLSFYVQTQNLSENNLSVKLLNEGFQIVTINNLQSTLEWTKYEAYIKAPAHEVNINVKLQIGSFDALVTGYAFFDNIVLEEIDVNDYADAKESSESTVSVIDLNAENFNVINSSTTKGLYKPLNATASNNAGTDSALINAGVLDTENFGDGQIYYPDLTNPNSQDDENTNVLMISSLEDTDYSYMLNNPFKVVLGNHYKISVYAKTFNLSQEAISVQTDDEDNAYDFGANIKLLEYDDTFMAINTQLGAITNEYKEYVFYIEANSDEDIHLSLSLGHENAYTKGYAFFSNISMSLISEESYDEQVALISDGNAQVNIINILTAAAIDDEDEDEDPEVAGTNFDFLLIPTLILSISIIIAILGYAIRQIKFTKIIRRKIKAQIYDRNRTLAVDHERRQVVKERQERLAKLKQNLAEIEAQIVSNEKQYKLEVKQLKEIKDEDLIKPEKAKKLDDKELKQARKLERYKQKQIRDKAYDEKKVKLQKQFDKIEKEIEKLEREERIMFEKYRNYKAQVNAIKVEIKQKQKTARIKAKARKQKAKAKKSAEKDAKKK
jgi:hypothetical protein